LSGAGDASRSLRAFAEDRFNPDIGHLGYSDQLMRACKSLGLELFITCTHPRAEDLTVGDTHVLRRNDPLAGRKRWAYQLAHVAAAEQIVADAIKLKADAVIVPTEPYPFLLEPLRFLGVSVIQSLHCVLWPFWRPRPAAVNATASLLGRAYRKNIAAVLSASHYITEQVQSLAGPAACPIVEFLPTFREEAYRNVPAPTSTRPFRVMFVGRFEEDKGVLTLLEVARRLRALGRSDVVFDMCGDGSAFESVKATVAREGLTEVFVLHGWCNADRLKHISGTAHAFVVPTTTGFIEGFNHAVIEGLLVGRPIVTSRVCPAVDYVSGGVSLVEPDDAESYLGGILRLADRPEHYERLQRASLPAAAPFLASQGNGDRFAAHGFAAAVTEVLAALAEGRAPKTRLISTPVDASARVTRQEIA
jgi:glycosyltransferase involved in cell wall biosynthesis